MKFFLTRILLFPLLLCIMVAGILSWSQPMPGHLPPVNATRYGAIPHPHPVLTFGGKRSGASLSTREFPKPAVLVPTFDKVNIFARIEKFTVCLTGPKDTFTQTYTGNLLPADMVQRITGASPGSKLQFKDVVCQLADDTKWKMEATYTLIK